MIGFEHILAVTAFALISSATPGPNNLMLMASGTNFGMRRTLPHLFGVFLGFLVMIALVGIGFSKVFEMYPLVYTGMKILSVGYLLFLAWKIANAAPPENAQAESTTGKPITFMQGVMFQWVNPKAWAMSLTAVTAYNMPESPLLGLTLILVAFGLMGLPSITMWAYMGTHVRRFLNDKRKLQIFNWSCASLLVLTLYPILF